MLRRNVGHLDESDIARLNVAVAFIIGLADYFGVRSIAGPELPFDAQVEDAAVRGRSMGLGS
jgi:hypothetical protein